MENSKSHSEYNWWGIGIAILGLCALAFFIDLSQVKSWVEQAGVWGAVVFILLKISTIVIAPLSGGPLYPIVGIVFGFWPGILYVLIGDVLGVTIAFYLSRIFGQKFVRKLLSNKEESLMAKIVDHIGDKKGFFQACLASIALPEALAYGAGLSRLPYLTFIFILAPMQLVISSTLVFFGSLLNPESSSLWITIGIPILGAFVIGVGGYFFARGIKKKSIGG